MGTFKDTEDRQATSCTKCPEGRFGGSSAAQSSSSHCQKCPSGYFGANASATSCTSCPAGRYGQFPGDTSSSCTARCPESLRASCTPGTASPLAPIIGYYLADVATKSLAACPAGKFKPTLDFEPCSGCPIGKYTATNASTYCPVCLAGSRTNTGTDAGASSCIA